MNMIHSLSAKWRYIKEEVMCKPGKQSCPGNKSMDILVLDYMTSRAAKSCCLSHLGHDICDGSPSWDKLWDHIKLKMSWHFSWQEYSNGFIMYLIMVQIPKIIHLNSDLTLSRLSLLFAWTDFHQHMIAAFLSLCPSYK